MSTHRHSCGGEPPRHRPLIAVYLSSHGYGHGVRTSTVLEQLVRLLPALRFAVVGTFPRSLWPRALRNSTSIWRAQACDVGVVQPNDLLVDHSATLLALQRWRLGYQARLEKEVRWLKRTADLVVGDVPPLAFDAAAGAGIPAIAVANFSWDWIYGKLGWVEAQAEARSSYHQAQLLIECEPCAPMTEFRHRVQVGLIGRRSEVQRDVLRRRLGLGPAKRLIILAFRTSSTSVFRLPPASPGLCYALSHELPSRPDVLAFPPAMPFADLVTAADVLVAKPGYGIIGDSAACGTPLLYTIRDGFPEHAVLVRWLRARPGSCEVRPELLRKGAWRGSIERLLSQGRPPAHPAPGAVSAARELARALANSST